MLSDRAPLLSEKADVILDNWLDGKCSDHKRDEWLQTVIEALPPKECGCYLCSKREASFLPDAELVGVTNENEEEDGA